MDIGVKWLLWTLILQNMIIIYWLARIDGRMK
jgi:hypothetical protein